MNTTTFTAFGWRLDRYTFEAGEQYTIELRKDTPKEQLGNRTFYVRGTATGVADNPNYAPPSRHPGFFYKDMPDLVLAATTVYTANEPLEWWCMNWHQNNRALPEIDKFVASVGTNCNLASRMFLCKGQLQVGGQTFSAPCEVPAGSAVVTQDAYGILFS